MAEGRPEVFLEYGGRFRQRNRILERRCRWRGAGDTAGKAKAKPAIAVVRISFSFRVAPLGPSSPSNAWSSTPNRRVQERGRSPPTSPTQYRGASSG